MNGVDLEPALPQRADNECRAFGVLADKTRDPTKQTKAARTEVVHYRRTVFDARYSIILRSIVLIVAIVQPDARQQRTAASSGAQGRRHPTTRNLGEQHHCLLTTGMIYGYDRAYENIATLSWRAVIWRC